MNAAPPDLANGAQADLRQRAKAIMADWPEGAVPDAAAALRAHPGLTGDKIVLLDLAYEEYRRRRDAGEKIDPNAFCARFPNFRSALWDMLRVDALFSKKLGEEKGPPIFLQPGEPLGDYTMVRELGRGAFAQVFLARESATGNRPVVVKLSGNKSGEREAQTLGPLTHPNVVPVLSISRDEALGVTIVCMPFLGVATLEDVLDRVHGGPPPRRAVRLLEAARALSRPDDPPVPAADPDPVLLGGPFSAGVLLLGARLAEALAFLHAKGVCHRDLKPSNVLVGPDGCPRLLDFNLAAERAAGAADLGGTVAYAAPEQVRALLAPCSSPPPDERADLYSLGVILHELLTGRHPFGRPAPDLSSREMGERLLPRQEAGCPLPKARGLNRTAARLIGCCLAFDPAERPTAAELAAGLREALGPGRLRRWGTRHPRAVWGLACLVPLVVGAAVAGLRDDFRPQEAEVRHPHEAGILAYNEGRYAEAAEDFAGAIAANRGDFQSRLYRGFALLRQSRGVSGPAEDNLIRPAALELEEVQRNGPSALARVCLAYCYTSRVWHMQALRLTDDDAKADGATTALLNNRACNFLQTGQLEAAERALAAIDPKERGRPEVCYNRAILVYQRRHQHQTMVVTPQGKAWFTAAKVPLAALVSPDALADIEVALKALREQGAPAPPAAVFQTAAGLYAFASGDEGRRLAVLFAPITGPSGNSVLLASALPLREQRQAKAIEYLRRATELGLQLPPPEADPVFYPHLHDCPDFHNLPKAKSPAAAPPSLALRLLNPAPDRLP
jgi:hypothetical protein